MPSGASHATSALSHVYSFPSMFISEAPIVAIFNPIDTMGPAHRGNQTLQQLAQGAAQNVMRRQKMRALLQQGARGAATGGTQPLRSSVQLRPTGVRGATLHSPVGAAGLGRGVSTGTNFVNPDGVTNESGGGYDYPSLADPNDPSQSASSITEGPMSSVPPPSGPNPGGGFAGSGDQSSTAAFIAGLAPNSSQWVDAVTQANANGGVLPSGYIAANSAPPTSGGQPADGANGAIHLGGGLYYDPVTDSVHGMPTNARR